MGSRTLLYLPIEEQRSRASDTSSKFLGRIWQGLNILTPNIAILKFRSGNAIVVSSVSAAEEDFVKNAGPYRAGLIQLLGPEAMQSGFDFKRSILEATPEQITLFTPRKVASAKLMLLTIKANTTRSGAESGVFQLSSQSLRGFQFGRPGSSGRRVSVELFSEDGSINFVFGQKKDAPFISQADINRILRTVRKLPPPPVNASSSEHAG